MNITLRAGERLYINGAVIRTDRKTTIELLNDATFLLETHVMQAADANTPLRQIYFVLQVMLMDPASAKTTSQLVRSLIDKSLDAFAAEDIKARLRNIVDLVSRGRYFEAMKAIRAMYALERSEMFPSSADMTSSNAA